MKNKSKRRKFITAPRLITNLTNSGWRFLIINKTACMSGSTSAFLAPGDLVVLRPEEQAGFMPADCFYGIEVPENLIKKCLELFSVALFDKWNQSESLIISLSMSGSEYIGLVQKASEVSDAYSRDFLLRQTVVGCIAEMVRKAKYGQQTLPPILSDVLKLMKEPEIVKGSFAQFRKASGMSESNLARLFARYDLEVPSEVFRKTKFETAKGWIESGESYTECAKRLGYTEKGFKKVYHEYFRKED